MIEESILEARDIGYRIQGRDLLAGVGLTARPGRIHALIGPNGAGKSTLLKVLAGDYQPSRGQCSMAGKPIVEWPLKELSCMRSVMPQLGRMEFPLSAREVVALGRMPRGRRERDRDDRVVEESLHRAGVSHLALQNYNDLSGGEQQRVQFARILAQETPVLLLDEPVSALDVRYQLLLMETLTALAREGRTVTVVMHDMNLALRYADEVTLLYQGRVLSQGPATEVVTPEHIQAAYGVRSERHWVPGLAKWQVTLLGPIPHTGQHELSKSTMAQAT